MPERRPQVTRQTGQSLGRWLNDFKEQGSPAARLRAFHVALGVLVLPTLPLGLLYALLGPKPARLPPLTLLWLSLLALALSAAAYWLTKQTERDPLLPRPTARLAAAFQLGGVPALPWLLACAFLYLPLWSLWLGLLGGLGYAVARWQLREWEAQN